MDGRTCDFTITDKVSAGKQFYITVFAENEVGVSEAGEYWLPNGADTSVITSCSSAVKRVVVPMLVCTEQSFHVRSKQGTALGVLISTKT